MKKAVTIAAIPFLVLLAAACSKQEHKQEHKQASVATAALLPKPALPSEETLMRAAFGQDYRATWKSGSEIKKHVALTKLPNPDHPENKEANVVEVSKIVSLPTGEALLATCTTALGDDGQPGHYAGGEDPCELGIYIFHFQDKQWQLGKRFDQLPTFGNFSKFHNVEMVEIGPQKTGLLLTTTSGFLHTMDLYDVSGGNLQQVAKSISTGGDNSGWGGVKIDSAYTFAKDRLHGNYYDLVLKFSGTTSPENTEESNNPDCASSQQCATKKAEKISGEARYEFDGKTYQLKEGKNIIGDYQFG